MMAVHLHKALASVLFFAKHYIYIYVQHVLMC